MQNVPTRKNMQKYFSFRTKVFFFHKKTNVLDRSAFFDGAAQNVTDWSITYSIFLRLPKDTPSTPPIFPNSANISNKFPLSDYLI